MDQHQTVLIAHPHFHDQAAHKQVVDDPVDNRRNRLQMINRINRNNIENQTENTGPQGYGKYDMGMGFFPLHRKINPRNKQRYQQT